MLLALLLAAQDPLAPLDYWVGKCWRTEVAPDTVDTHCFTRDPAGVHDHHEVTAKGEKIYQGDTDYRWDGTNIRYAYRNDNGPVSEGVVAVVPEGLEMDGIRWLPSRGGFTMLNGTRRREFVRVE
ncbi:hypothetical protein P6144_06010 [Sphingomonas sp. HITSZ_GF]|uniref:hypothetical protein n=1 Tax=Sphingomonas sp. HITSZ_GF TaxID=3037247 RepID=UPI00240DE696|nr:hypothetical protein [Sphingomonas sp. HITSZ_GF]MDG2533192.1 hypothetical protein [Sphingomonas sp. HITSZ_GF]